ncbi:glutamate racemase [Patescibacteria group bacterium]|nr:glutamate racemase [Patescibacteria group bacterium]
MNNRPIGVFDSGLGGLTVVKEIKKILPNEKIVYLGDTARVPYGTRSKETIIKFAIEDVNFLLKKNVKCIVIACNSVSSVAVPTLKKQFKVPIIDVITPTCEFIAKNKNIKKVGIIGTSATVKSNTYKNTINKLNKKIKVFQNEAPLLVPLVEEGENKSSFTYQIVQKYLKPLIDKNVDMLILGCTHYPVLLPIFRKILGNKIEIIDPARCVSKYLKKYLKEKNLLNDGKISFVDFFAVTDLTDGFLKQLKIFFGKYKKNNLVKISLTK